MTIVVYGDKQMTNTKIIIALVAVAALTLATIGLAAAQIGQNQTAPWEKPNTAVPGQGFWGWLGNCFGYGVGQPYDGQYVDPPVVSGNQAATPYQGGYGYGPCWAR